MAYINDCDEEAFDKLYKRHAPYVYGKLLRFYGDPHLAEEVAQETWKAFSQTTSYDPRGQFRAFVWAIAVNRAKSERRQVGRRKIKASTTFVEDMTVFDRPVRDWLIEDQVIFELEVERALATLSDAHRAVVRLRYLQDLSVRDTAKLLGIPESTVKTQYYRALKNLERQFEKTNPSL